MASEQRTARLLLGGLAVARLTRLVTADEATRRPRDRALEWAAGTAERRAHPQLAYLLTCPWCVSPWLAAGWAALDALAPGPARALGAVLAWSELAGLAAQAEA